MIALLNPRAVSRPNCIFNSNYLHITNNFVALMNVPVFKGDGQGFMKLPSKNKVAFLNKVFAIV